MSDANRDGVLNKDEFYNFVHPQNIKLLSDIETKKTMFDLDHDKDRKISFNEYKLYMGDVEQAATDSFKEYDKNSDGYLDVEETRLWIMPDYVATAEDEIKHLLKETDDNKDGVLSRAEMLNHSDLFTTTHANRIHDEL